MSQKEYLVTLTSGEQDHLENLLAKGKASAPVRTSARIPLKADQSDGGPALDGAAIADDLEVGLRTISRVRSGSSSVGSRTACAVSASTSRAGNGPSTAPPRRG